MAYNYQSFFTTWCTIG